MPAARARFSSGLDWNLLKLFNAIVEAGGVSAAARRLNRNQPAISLALKRLEAGVGARLCQRGPAGFRLTDAGRRVAEIAAGLERGVSGLPPRLADAGRDLKGRVRLQVISNVVHSVFDRALAAFHSRHPSVELVIEVDTWDAIGRNLLRGEADIGVAPARFQHAQLRYDLLFREVHRPYCGRGHALFGKHVGNPRSLAGYGFVLTGDDEPDDLTKFRLRYGLGRQVAGLSEHLEEAKRLALAGVGICFLPEDFARPEVKAGRLWALDDRRRGPTMSLYVITNPEAATHMAGELFLAELRRRASKPPAKRRKKH